jgi:hypothetical protein
MSFEATECPTPAPRSAPSPAPARKKTPALTAFYGYPAAEIANWCRVSLLTARLYKSGIRKPSRAAFRLFVLHRDGRALGDGWAGWSVRGQLLIDPDGNATTQGQLRAYYFVYQLAAEYGRRDAVARDRFRELRKAG